MNIFSAVAYTRQNQPQAVLVEQCSETTTDGPPTWSSAPEVPVDFSPATSTLTMPVGRSAKRSGADFSRDEHGQRRDGASSDRVAAAALLLSVGNMVRWALSLIRFLRFAFFCRRRDPRLKNGEKGQKFACAGKYAAAREMSGWSKGDRAESIGSQSR